MLGGLAWPLAAVSERELPAGDVQVRKLGAVTLQQRQHVVCLTRDFEACYIAIVGCPTIIYCNILLNVQRSL